MYPDFNPFQSQLGRPYRRAVNFPLFCRYHLFGFFSSFVRNVFLRLDLLGSLLDGIDVLLDILLHILDDGGSAALLGGLVHADTGELSDTDEGEEEVDGGEAR